MRQSARVARSELPHGIVSRYERSLERARQRQRPDATPFSDKDSWYHEAIELESIQLPRQTNAELRIIRGAETVVVNTLQPARFAPLRAAVAFIAYSALGLAMVGLFLWAPLVIVASYFARDLPSAALIAGGVALVGELIVLRILFITTRRRKAPSQVASRGRQ